MNVFKISKTDFESVYDRYADMLYRLAFSHLQSSEDASFPRQGTAKSSYGKGGWACLKKR